ncbi:MAG TPA: ABC transporter substrate-binding protein [Acidimicrobiales bacterium]|nr:ABC transporter substrate-binding protein [Acidimicrobiales bacterium]
MRVAVWGSPDPAASTLAGAGVRGLVLPQLFYAKPDGRWGPLLVEPGSDLATSDFTSARFRLRAGASWSDGSPIGVDDLRRSADARFVAALEGPLADGTITVRFTQPLPGWRRLWSLDSSVSPPRPGIWGGPFVVASATPGLEVVLHPNPAWPGPRPFLDEVRLVLVPDATTARQLLAAGEVDVVAPPAETRRTPRLEAIPGVRVDAAAADGGWWVGLLQQPDRLDVNRRRSLAATIDRARFVSVLLQGEAGRLDGLGGADDATWSGVGWVGASSAQAVEGLSGATVDLVGQIEEPMTGLLHRSMQKRTRDAGGRLELRAAEADRVEGWLAERSYDAAIVLLFDGPSVCWTCRWGNVDPSLAAAADSGDLGAVAALEAKLAAENLVVPLWRPRAVVAWREEVVAPLRANPYGLSPAWDAWRWHRP